MKSWFRVPIRVQLLLIVAIVAIPAAFIIIYTEMQTKNRELEHARIDTQNIVETVASEQQVLVASTQQLLTILAQLPEINDKDRDATNRFLGMILNLHPNLLNIFVADRKGAVWASAIPYTHPVDISDRRYFKNAMATGRLSAGDFQVGRITHRPSLNLGLPYRDQAAKVVGVICVGIELNKYAEVLRLAQMGAGGNLVLMDYKGTILFSTGRDSMRGQSFDKDLFATMRSGPDADTRTVVGRGGDSRTRYISYRKMRLDADPEPYMYALVSVPSRPIVAEVNRQIAIKMSQLLLVLSTALILSWFIGKKAIADRIELLKMASQKLAEGDDQIRVSHLVEGGELGMLGEVFDHMAQQLSLRQEVLLQRESDLKKAHQLAKLGSWKMDENEKLTWSSEMYKIFEVSPDSFDLSTETFLELIHPDDKDAMVEWIEACKGGDCNHELVFRAFTQDGCLKYISGRGDLVLDSYGKVIGMAGTAQDITDRKKIEKALIEKQRQLEELNQYLEQKVAESVSELRKKDKILIAQSRQAAMGETIGNIAHQWRQPLNTLGLIVQELKLTYELGGFTKEYLDGNVDKAMLLITHMSKTIDEFQNFFKPNATKSRFSINAAIAKTLLLIESSLKKQNISIEKIERDRVEVDGYGNEYSQVLLNILNNSRDAFEVRNIENKRITITIFKEEGRSVVTVADNAGGIADDVIDKIFDPYFTTKGPDKGTGIGLYMARNIIEKHMDGILSVRNVAGGTEFRIEV
ncbi:cache domain-containing protein [Geomonas paludis]|uniref:histidine kinase n=1 Tax=Geomonas paludis TaxID=2740185 RepID=A0A6V8MUR5_9BACT|nr:cache domain-containing protein [Geomonas paludis]GFO63634.1 hypothetical protein GMPD_15530 [Geomonas paludis]